ncbi:MAG: ArnT family glycosyltransferase, partial [Candidatus Binatia bacterium]
MRRAPAAPVLPRATDPLAGVPGFATLGLALLLSVAFAALIIPWLDAMPWEYDEGTFMLQARAILRGEVPFVDFFHHQPPLHLYLLAASGKLFGQTIFGYRLLSVASIGLSGVLLFLLIRPFAGPLPALVAQAIFLFSPSQVHALAAVAEVPMVTATLLGAALLFLGARRWSAYAAGVAFVAALLIKPTCLPMVAAAGLSLVYARDWRRLRDLVLAGIVAAAAGLAWTWWLSDGIFTDIARFQLVERLGTRAAGMWSIDSGFGDLRRAAGVETPAQWALVSFKDFQLLPDTPLPLVLSALAVPGMAAWVLRCARGAPAVRAFAVLWPLSYLLLNFVAMDYVSAKNFAPFIAFTAFLLAGLLSVAQRAVPPLAAGAVGLVVCGALAACFATIVAPRADPWYSGRADWIARQYP